MQPFVSQFASSILHFIWCYYFIVYWDLQIRGAAIAMNITYFLNFIFLEIWITSSDAFIDNWHNYHSGSGFSAWRQYFKVGWYGAILECLGWWNLNICFLFSGYLGVAQIAAQVVVMQIKNFTTMIPTGVAFAASGLVGNCIGMNQVERAKSYTKVNIFYSGFVTLILLLTFSIYRVPLSDLFTDNEEIAKVSRDCFWSLFLYIFFSSIKGVQNGIIRALGKQKQNAKLTLVFAYGFGVPLAALFCFTFKMGLTGIWFGIAIANFLLVLAIQYHIKTAEWESIALNMEKIGSKKHMVRDLLSAPTGKGPKKSKTIKAADEGSDAFHRV